MRSSSVELRRAPQIVEYTAGNENGNPRKGAALTTAAGASWTAVSTVQSWYIYNSVVADYVAVTSTGKVTAFQVATPCNCDAPVLPAP